MLERAAAAGFVVEQRAEGLMAIDPDRIATDERFPAPNDNAKQAALLLADRFTFEATGSNTGSARGLVTVDLDDLANHLSGLMHKHNENPANAEQARALWDRVGVVHDKYSVAVTVVGLEPAGADPLASALRSLAHHGEPFVVTLAQLQRWPIRVRPCDVFLFENASTLSMAVSRAASGPPWDGPPLVSTAGWPNTAVFVLCSQLAASGCRLFHHGDFDPTGIEITRYLAERAGAVPWRMSSSDYLAVARGSSTEPKGTVTETPWDPDLAVAMRSEGKTAYEEDIVGELLDKLREGRD